MITMVECLELGLELLYYCFTMSGRPIVKRTRHLLYTVRRRRKLGFGTGQQEKPDRLDQNLNLASTSNRYNDDNNDAGKRTSIVSLKMKRTYDSMESTKTRYDNNEDVSEKKLTDSDKFRR